MKKNLVSIILINWNGKKWLKKCLSSLQNQTYKNVEIIVVDNGSSDDSVEYLQNNFPKARVIQNKKNLGLPKAVNIGVKSSKGQFLLLINNDTWVDKNFIGNLLKFYSRNDFSVISPIVRDYNGSEVNINLPNIDPTGSTAYFFPITRKDKLFFLSVCYFCSKREYIETLGFDENYFAYYEDVDWFWRMALLNKKVSYVDDVFIYHEGAGSLGKGIKYKMFLWRNQNTLQTLIKNYSLISLVLILPLYFLQNIFEILFFLFILKFDIAFSYVEGWLFNARNLKKILKKRRWVQQNRKVGDLEIFKKMYIGPAKLIMLKDYLK